MKRTLNWFANILTDRRGNIAPIFALSLLPLCAAMALSVDLGLASRMKESSLQSLDAALLAAVRTRLDGGDRETMERDLKGYFEVMRETQPGNTTCTEPELSPGRTDREWVATSRCSTETLIAGVIGKDNMDFSISSRVTTGIGKLDIAFVFDVSGSMNDPSAPGYGQPSKLSALKSAAKEAVENLLDFESTDRDDVRIGLVSYSTAVNAGSYFHAVTGESATRTYEEDIVEGRWERECDGWRWWTCEWVWRSETVTVTRTIDNTCTYERNSSEAFDATRPRSGHYLSYGSPEYNESTGNWTNVADCNDAAPQPLTNNVSTLTTYIDRLAANGGTAGHLGVAWGRYLISPEWSSVWPTDSDPLAWDEPDSQKVIIMMTDGAFNSTYHGGLGSSFDQAKAQCDAAKDEHGVLIYTVAFNAPLEGRQILEYCSSGAEFAFDAQNGQELLDAYTAIAQSISDLRISG